MAAATRKKDPYVKNLTTFVRYLPETHIKFVFFRAENMDTPLIVTTFGKHGDWYIVPGRDANYCYAYKKSDLCFMVTDMRLKQKSTISLYTAKLNHVRQATRLKSHQLKSMMNDIAYLGNHIDFSVQDNQSGDVYYKTHWTAYFERTDAELTFERKADEICNFMNTTIHARPFGKTSCIDSHNQHLYRLDRIFQDKKHQEIVEDLWKASNGQKVSQKGGMPPRHEPYGYKSYKDMDTLRPEFYNFMNRSIFSKLFDEMDHTPFYVYRYFDEGNELHANGNKAIQYVVEYDEARTIAFVVSSHRALKACWAELNSTGTSLREKRALRSWHRACSEFLVGFHPTAPTKGA